MPGPTLYDTDFFAWASQQADLLRAGKIAEADMGHIAEEIESLGRTEKRELVSRLTVLLLHLLKWQFQPSHRGASWRASINNARDDIADHLAESPSLKPQIAAATVSAYRRALRQAAAETGLDERSFPPACPWAFEQIVDETFWPGGA